MMVVLSKNFYFFRILFWLAMYRNVSLMLQSTGHFNVHYMQKSFVKQNSIWFLFGQWNLRHDHWVISMKIFNLYHFKKMNDLWSLKFCCLFFRSLFWCSFTLLWLQNSRWWQPWRNKGHLWSQTRDIWISQSKFNETEDAKCAKWKLTLQFKFSFQNRNCSGVKDRRIRKTQCRKKEKIVQRLESVFQKGILHQIIQKIMSRA